MCRDLSELGSPDPCKCLARRSSDDYVNSLPSWHIEAKFSCKLLWIDLCDVPRLGVNFVDAKRRLALKVSRMGFGCDRVEFDTPDDFKASSMKTKGQASTAAEKIKNPERLAGAEPLHLRFNMSPGLHVSHSGFSERDCNPADA